MSPNGGRYPAGWRTASIAELAEFVTSGSRGWAKYHADDGPLFLRVGNLDHDTVDLDLSDVQHVQPPGGAEGERTRVQPGDILLSITADVGMVGVARERLGEAYVNQHVALIRPLPSVYPRGLAYSLLDPTGLQAVARRQQYGATKPALNLDQVRGFVVPIPPLREQGSIVGAIDSYLSRIDEAEAALQRVQRNLKRYRVAVLHAAVGGRLVPTEAELARAQGRDYEPATDLLRRILAERRRRWEEIELARLKSYGTARNDDRWKAFYEEPVPPERAGLGDLPAGWSWVSIDQLGEVSGGLTKNPDRDRLLRRMPYLRVANVYANDLRLGDVETIGVAESELHRTLLERGDLLVVEGNGSLDQIGRVAVWSGSIDPCLHQNHLIKVRFRPVTLSSWVLWWLLSPSGRHEIQRLASSTSGLHTLSLSKVRSLPVPLPPVEEQERITAEVERRLSIAVSSADRCADNERRLMRLRHAILKWAFEGKLVDQDPSDEPASVLLDRIRAERAAHAAAATRRPTTPEKRHK